MRARPVIRGRQPPVTRPPLAYRGEHALAGPAPPDRARMAYLAVGVGVALAVARLGVGAAAAAHADVARLDGPRLLAGGVVEVRLDRRGRAPRRSAIWAIERPSASRKCRASATARRRSTTRSTAAAEAFSVMRATLSPLIGVLGEVLRSLHHVACSPPEAGGAPIRADSPTARSEYATRPRVR
jgi:hypothetical protein